VHLLIFAMADSTLLDTVDHALRGGAMALVLLMAALLLRDHRRSLAARLGAAFAIGVAAYAVCSAEGFATHPALWHLPILMLCLGNSVVFWLFARALFRESFRLRWWHAALWAIPVADGAIEVLVLLPARSPAAPIVGVALTLTSLAFALLAVAQTLAGWRVDLVEGRRRLRIFIVGASAAYCALIGAAELIFRTGPVPPLATTLNAAGLASMAAVIAWSVLQSAGEDLFPPRLVATVAPSGTRMIVAATPAPGIRGEDEKLLRALERLMTVERAYRQEGLSIGALALKLGIPEYRLRRLINQGLGYRNFTAFLNGYRIAEAKAALADPAQAAVPVLTIALDAGFQSLPPFNRAFKTETGQTPSDYRRSKVGGGGK
jgi:AraC-like DNA-binding protein